jgi:hypothetical protein
VHLIPNSLNLFPFPVYVGNRECPERNQIHAGHDHSERSSPKRAALRLPVVKAWALRNCGICVSDSFTKRKELQAKIDRAHKARIKAEQFIDAGGELNSHEAGAIGTELVIAAYELAREFGQPGVKEVLPR